MARCRLTDRMYVAAVDGRLEPDDRAHIAACRECRRAVNQAAAFDRELETATSQLAGAALPAGMLEAGMPRSRARRTATGLVVLGSAAALVLAAGVAAWGGYRPAPDPGEDAASPAPTHDLHVLVSNHRRFAATIVVSSQLPGGPTRVAANLPACGGSYVAVPLGTTWAVEIGEIRYAGGPPSPISETAGSDLTVRLTYGLGGADVLAGTPADLGLDPEEIVSASVAPCR